MKLRQKISAGMGIYKSILLKKKIPVAVRWELTFRCTNRCQYCSLWKGPFPHELTKDEIFRITDDLARSGTKRISLSGGEPMLRADVGEIINYIAGKGISVSMNTDGVMVADRASELQALDLVKISVDGDEKTHNFLAGNKNSYQQAVSAARAVRNIGVPLIFTTTMTKYNLDKIDYLVNLAREYDAMVAFQPFKVMYKGVSAENGLLPNPAEMRLAINRIIELKKVYPKNIRNTMLSLEHIINWPKFSFVKCRAGQIFFIINPDGTLLPCDRADGYTHTNFPNLKNMSINEAINGLPTVICNGCGFLGALELNYIASFKIPRQVVKVLDYLTKK